jgi:hypothetical protein
MREELILIRDQNILQMSNAICSLALLFANSFADAWVISIPFPTGQTEKEAFP